MSDHVLVRDLRKAYQGRIAVDGISFEVERGSIFGLLGPNGAGKTTTIECLIGLREPDSGTIEVAGFDARRESRQMKEKIGVALQTTALQDAVTPREALDLIGSFYRQPAGTGELLRRFRLEERAAARFSTLSGGERQRLALALAFVNQPEIVVLDEPTAGLDTQMRRELREEIRQIRASGCTVILSTHDLAEAEELCDRVAIIDRGRILARGRPAELLGSSGHLQTVRLEMEGVVDPETWSDISDLRGLEMEGPRVVFQTENATAAMAAVTRRLHEAGRRIRRLSIDQSSLEDVFLNLTNVAKDSREEAKDV